MTSVVGLLGTLAAAPWVAAQETPTPGYNTKIPESILTPHDLETRIGTFKYFDGIPTKETAEAIYMRHYGPSKEVSNGKKGYDATKLIRRVDK